MRKDDDSTAKLFWTGGSQAVRLPKQMRMPGTQALIRRRGSMLVLEPLADDDDWGDFWARLVPLERPIRRWRTRRAERRRPI